MASSSSSSEAYEARQAMPLVSLQDIEAAAERIRASIIRTPVLTNDAIDQAISRAISKDQRELIPIKLAHKAEHLQVVGAFKSRGASNAIQTQVTRLRRSNPSFDASKLCALTHSSGNHGAALSLQSQRHGVQAAVVMPENAPDFKKENVASYGARVWFCPPTQEARERVAAEARETLEKEGLTVEFIHPYDDEAIIAGQGTMGMELMEQVKDLEKRGGCSYAGASTSKEQQEGPNQAWEKRDSSEPPLDIVIAPVGGGGMLSGVATAVKGIDSRTLVVGAEPADADDAQRSFTTHVRQPPITPPRTICDGLLTSLSERTLAHIERRVDLIATTSDTTVVAALDLVLGKMKQLIEPSAAVGIAALMENEDLQNRVRSVYEKKGKKGEVRIGVIWSGGNTTVQTLAEHMNRLGPKQRTKP